MTRRLTDPPPALALRRQIAWTEAQARQHRRLASRATPASAARALNERQSLIADDVADSLRILLRQETETRP